MVPHRQGLRLVAKREEEPRPRPLRISELLVFGDQKGGCSRTPKTRSSLILNGRGRVTGTVRLPGSGEYAIWIAGDFGRVVRVSVDGKQVAAVEHDHSYSDQYVELARRHLDAGEHRVSVSKPGGNLDPGDASGDEVPVGPIVFVRPRRLPVRTAPVSDARRICDRGGLDWMEIVGAR